MGSSTLSTLAIGFLLPVRKMWTFDKDPWLLELPIVPCPELHSRLEVDSEAGGGTERALTDGSCWPGAGASFFLSVSHMLNSGPLKQDCSMSYQGQIFSVSSCLKFGFILVCFIFGL
jgi:hypothetical protein